MTTAISTYTDKQLAKLTPAQVFEAIRQEAILHSVEPPTEVFAIDPPNFAYAGKAAANKVPTDALQITVTPTGTVSTPVVLAVMSKWVDPADPLAFKVIYDAGMARFNEASSVDVANQKLVDKANVYLTTANNDPVVAQAFWNALETKPWPL